VVHSSVQIVILKEGQVFAHLSLNPCIFMWREGHSSPPSSSASSTAPSSSCVSSNSIDLVMFDLCPGLDAHVRPSIFPKTHFPPHTTVLQAPHLSPTTFETSCSCCASPFFMCAKLSQLTSCNITPCSSRLLCSCPQLSPTSIECAGTSPLSASFYLLCLAACILRTNTLHRNASRTEPYSSCTRHLQLFSPYATCPPEMPSFCSACRRVPPAHPRDLLCHATGILCRVDADGLSALHLSMCFGTEFACISISWQAKDSRMCEAEASDDDNDFIAAGSSCMWMPR
jgi:hypothetical protein